MFKKTRVLSVVVSAICALALLAMGATALAATGKHKAKGRADSGTSYVGTTHSDSKFTYSAGDNTDKLLGPGAVTYKLKVGSTPTVGAVSLTANPVRLFTATGSMIGTGSATLTVTGPTTATISNGKLKLTRGTGAQKGHSFVGTFTGSGNPSTGQYVFHYKGTYK
jgi:hypothetical protein